MDPLESELHDIIRLSSLKPGQENAIIAVLNNLVRDRKEKTRLHKNELKKREQEVSYTKVITMYIWHIYIYVVGAD